jgi:hypothetical protein
MFSWFLSVPHVFQKYAVPKNIFRRFVLYVACNEMPSEYIIDKHVESMIFLRKILNKRKNNIIPYF